MRKLEEMQGGKQMTQGLQRHRAHLMERHVGRYRGLIMSSFKVKLSWRGGVPWRNGNERSKDRNAVQPQVGKDGNQNWENEEE